MRICYLNPDLGIEIDGTKGAAAHMRGLVAAFRNSGHEVTYAAPTTAGGEARIAAREPGLFDGLSTSAPPRVARALRHIWLNAGVESALLDALSSSPPDLIYERYGPFAVAGGVVARRLGVPHILEVNAPLAREGRVYRRQALSDAATALESTAFANTGAIIAVSEELRDELVEDGVDGTKIHVVPNGVDTRMFTPGPAPRQGDAISFGFVGGLRPWHGIEQMAQAFREVAGHIDARLVVVGDGPEGIHLRALAEELPDRVTLHGAVAHTEVPGILRSIDVALAPYPSLERFYYSPLKILEYMAAGRPIIASRIGQVETLLGDGETALLCTPGDSQSLASAMLRLARDPELQRALGARAADVALREHDWSARAADIIAVAEELG